MVCVKFHVGGTHPRKVQIVETACEHNVCHDTSVFLSLFFCFSDELCNIGTALLYRSGLKVGVEGRTWVTVC